jgi:predicted nucleic-acid-binding Zn-ribbon protein
MLGFIIFLGIVVGSVLVLRHLRNREIEAFREADMSVFEEFKAVREVKQIDPIAVKAQSFLTAKSGNANSKIVALPAAESVQPLRPVYKIRKELFSEVHRNFYRNLESVAGENYSIFVDVPLEEFVTVSQEKTGDRILKGKTISYLLCSKEALTVVCGIQLRGAGQELNRHFEFLKDLFLQIEKPLLDFPLVGDISREEIKEKLDFTDSPLARSCPKCGNEMLMRKAVKGKNTGKTFWVCSNFPSCKGITRIGRFQ